LRCRDPRRGAARRSAPRVYVAAMSPRSRRVVPLLLGLWIPLPIAFAAAVATVVALGASARPLAAQGCVDQVYVPAALTNGLEVTANQPVTQTFTVGRSGQLTQLEIARIRHHNGTATNPLTVAIVTTAGGVPTTTVLASVVFAPAAVPTATGPLLVDLTALNVVVQVGQELGIALTSPNAPGTPSYAWWGEAPGGGYAGGQIFIQQTVPLPVWDLAFRTWVATPASASTYGVGHPGTIGVPPLLASANPVLGTTPSLLVGSSTNVATLAALFLGVAAANVPTPWGGTALVQPLVSVGVALPPGGASVPFAIPNDPALCGFAVHAQAVVVDAGASQGLAFTAGLALAIGD
jgi:hypothetical protein